MKIQTVLGLAAMSMVGVLLVACSSDSGTSPAGTYQQTAQQIDGGTTGTGTQTYGMNGATGYQEQAQQIAARNASNQMVGGTASNGMYVNALNAPSNQTYYFDFDSNSVHAADYKALNIQANYLSSHPNARIRLEGNTDERGSREYNVGLGWRRDQSVAHYLEARGVAPKQIQMMSYGKEHPASFGHSEKAWRLNRRVNMIYKAKG